MNTRSVSGARHGNKRNPPDGAGSPSFCYGTVVIITLTNPREKFWGALLALDPAGVSVRGLELSSFEDSTNAVLAGDPLVANVLFFPMHRVERIQLDLPEGAIPSLSERFQSRTGIDSGSALLSTDPVKSVARSAGE